MNTKKQVLSWMTLLIAFMKAVAGMFKKSSDAIWETHEAHVNSNEANNNSLTGNTTTTEEANQMLESNVNTTVNNNEVVGGLSITLKNDPFKGLKFNHNTNEAYYTLDDLTIVVSELFKEYLGPYARERGYIAVEGPSSKVEYGSKDFEVNYEVSRYDDVSFELTPAFSDSFGVSIDTLNSVKDIIRPLCEAVWDGLDFEHFGLKHKYMKLDESAMTYVDHMSMTHGVYGGDEESYILFKDDGVTIRVHDVDYDEDRTCFLVTVDGSVEDVEDGFIELNCYVEKDEDGYDDLEISSLMGFSNPYFSESVYWFLRDRIVNDLYLFGRMSNFNDLVEHYTEYLFRVKLLKFQHEGSKKLKIADEPVKTVDELVEMHDHWYTDIGGYLREVEKTARSLNKTPLRLMDEITVSVYMKQHEHFKKIHSSMTSCMNPDDVISKESDLVLLALDASRGDRDFTIYQIEKYRAIREKSEIHISFRDALWEMVSDLTDDYQVTLEYYNEIYKGATGALTQVVSEKIEDVPGDEYNSVESYLNSLYESFGPGGDNKIPA